MKLIFRILRSMQFGIFLLILIMACSLIGSLVKQGAPADWYTRTYPVAGQVFLTLGFNDIFGSWYFVLIVILFCINLLLCCFTRLRNLQKAGKNILSRPGDYGSFIVHLSILLTFVFGGLVLYLSEAEDYSLLPGEALIMYDGTSIMLDSFRMFDETGRTDYVSVLHVTAPNETQPVIREISVNNPMRFRSYKYYQYSFGITASITAINNVTGGSDTFYLTERSFLSDDGRNGVWFETLYPGYITDSDGNIQPLIFPAGGGGLYPDPIYRLLVSDRGRMTSKMALPGEAITIGDITFVFNEPFYYPGIRVKNIPRPFPALLYISFVLMCIGFWLSFFHTNQEAC